MSVRDLFRGVQRVEAFLLSGSILLIAAMTITNVFTRTLFDRSLASVEELSQFLMVMVTFIGVSYGANRGRHIRMTALYDQLPHGPRKALMTGIAATTAVVLAMLAWVALQYVGTVRTLGTVSPALQVPLWWVYLAAPLGLALAAVQYGLAVVRNLMEDDVYVSFERTDAYEENEPSAM